MRYQPTTIRSLGVYLRLNSSLQIYFASIQFYLRFICMHININKSKWRILRIRIPEISEIKGCMAHKTYSIWNKSKKVNTLYSSLYSAIKYALKIIPNPWISRNLNAMINVSITCIQVWFTVKKGLARVIGKEDSDIDKIIFDKYLIMYDYILGQFIYFSLQIIIKNQMFDYLGYSLLNKRHLCWKFHFII